jgi:hypothetical protein
MFQVIYTSLKGVQQAGKPSDAIIFIVILKAIINSE